MPDPVVIEALPFRSGKRAKGGGGFPLGKILALLLFVLVIGGAIYAYQFFTSKTFITVVVQPADAAVMVTRLGDAGDQEVPSTGSFWAVKKEEYTISVSRPGYVAAETNFTCCAGVDVPLRLKLEEFPWGILRLEPPVEPRPEVFESGKPVDFSFRWDEVGDDWALPAGEHELDFRIPRHFPAVRTVQIPSRAETNTLTISFQPNWAPVQVTTVPVANVFTNEGMPGVSTPVSLELIEGTHPLTFKAEGFMTLRTQVVVRAGTAMELPLIALRKTNGLIRVTSSPSMANVNMANTFQGQTPITLSAIPDEEQSILIAKAGFKPARKAVIVSPGETVDIDVQLEALEGTIRFKVNPPGTELLVDGKSYGTVPDELKLMAVEHTIQLKKPGFKDYEVKLTPRAGFVSSIQTDLVPNAITQAKAGAPLLQAANGYEFVRVDPAPFRMGSSRREQGRRSNETLRAVDLKRSFYMGMHEVTNAAFREFKEGHDSGSDTGVTLNKNAQPVVNLTWQEAAAYCNWLSAQDGLAPAYVKSGPDLVAVSPMTQGYRMPTEAEWAYCARVNADASLLKYPWGESFPPKEKQGNYGDQSAEGVVALPIADYTDGYPTTAPPGSFAANRLGLFDLGGNVAEWCHDVYKIYSFDPEQVDTDPLGPESGPLKSIRGSSYRSAHIRTLRFAFRNYDKEPQEDVGFRICRYIE